MGQYIQKRLNCGRSRCRIKAIDVAAGAAAEGERGIGRHYRRRLSRGWQSLRVDLVKGDYFVTARKIYRNSLSVASY